MTIPRPLGVALIAVAAAVVLVIGTGAVLIARFNPNSYKPDIIQAVKHATGRNLALNGKITLKPSLWPTIQVENVAFSNPTGFSQPEMATLKRLDLQVALLPLLSHQIEIDRLVLVHPAILLETNQAGQPNWQMTPEVSPSTPAGTQSPVKSGKTTTAISVDTVQIEDGTLGYRDDATGKVTMLGLSNLLAKAASPDSPVYVDADASYNGTSFHLVGDTGSLTRLQNSAATSPWPVKLAVTAVGARLEADGSMTRPLQGKGYNLALSGMIPDLSALAPLLQGLKPPPLHDVTFAAKIADEGGALPEFSTLTLHVGASDLGARMPGLMLDKLDIDAPRADQPVKIDAAATFGKTPLAVVGTFGPPAQLLPNAKPAPFPVDVTIQAAGAQASAKGSIADARTMTGANIALAAGIPDLAALSPLARQPLPSVKNISFRGVLTDANGGFRHGAGLHGFSLTTSDGDLSGDAAISLGSRPSLTAALKSNRIDLDSLQAAMVQPPSAAPSPPPPATEPPRPSSKRSERLVSDRPFHFGLLRTADADVKLDVADLHAGGADYKAIDSHAVLKDGRLAINPLTAQLPGGPMNGSFSLDAMPAAAPVHVMLHAPGVALKTVLAAAHQPPYASGNLEIYADLSGAGDSPHAIAASLDGSLGLAMAGGTIDNRLLGSLLGNVMDSLNTLNLVGKGGNSEVRCFGMRMVASRGIATINPLALSSSLLTMSGSGTVNLGDETLALALRPQARVGGTNLVVPIAVSGPIRNPKVKVNDLRTAEDNAGKVAGAAIGDATPLGIVGGLLGGDKLLGSGTANICPAALAMARGQPVPQAAAAKTAKPSGPNPETLLKNLFR